MATGDILIPFAAADHFMPGAPEDLASNTADGAGGAGGGGKAAPRATLHGYWLVDGVFELMYTCSAADTYLLHLWYTAPLPRERAGAMMMMRLDGGVVHACARRLMMAFPIHVLMSCGIDWALVGSHV